MSEYTVTAKTLHVRDPHRAFVRIATCPEREVILNLQLPSLQDPFPYSVELTVAEAKDLIARLTQTLEEVETRPGHRPSTWYDRLNEDLP